MGYCAEPTPEMGEYSVEVRSGSFYLRGEDVYGLKIGEPRPLHSIWTNQGTCEFLTDDIPKLRAALDQVERIDAGEKR